MSTEPGDSRYERDPDYRRGLAVVEEHGAARRDVLVRSTACLLLHPLCLATGRVPVAMTWLHRNGFHVVYASVRKLDRQQVKRIWRYQIHSHDPARTRVVTDLLTCGPSLLLGLVAPPTPRGSTAARLNDLKGPADPRRATPHHLRAHLGAANMLNNLAHTPDGPAETIRESTVVVGVTSASALWAAATEMLATSRAPAVDVLNMLPPVGEHGGISLAHVGVALRARLLEEIRRRLGPRHGLGDATTRIAHEQAWVQCHDPGEPVAVLAAYRDRFRPLMGAVGRAVADRAAPDASELRDLTTLFGHIECALFGAEFDFDSVAALAARIGLPLEARDRLVLSTEWVCRTILDAPAEPDASATAATQSDTAA